MMSWIKGDFVRVGGEGERLTVFHTVGNLACCRRPGSESVTLAGVDTLEWAPPEDGGDYMRCQVVISDSALWALLD